MLFALLFFVNTAFAAQEPIDYAPYKDFWRKWPFVTTRFREDTRELRFVFANEIAMKALREDKLPYPDGAVFAKLASPAGNDPHFPASKIPTDKTRFQIMVKDSKRFPETNGWGYIYTGPDGKNWFKSMGEVVACHACHRIVPGLDYVFARPFDEKFPKAPGEGPRFIDSDGFRRIVSAADVNAFHGTSAELRPLLVKEAYRSGKPARFLSKDGIYESIVKIDPAPCKDGRVGYTATERTEAGKYEIRDCTPASELK